MLARLDVCVGASSRIVGGGVVQYEVNQFSCAGAFCHVSYFLALACDYIGLRPVLSTVQHSRRFLNCHIFFACQKCQQSQGSGGSGSPSS